MRKSIYSQRQQQVRLLLIEKRRAARLTQSDVARKLGRPQSYVSNYERGERRLDLVEFLEIAEAIGFDAPKFIRQLKQNDIG